MPTYSGTVLVQATVFASAARAFDDLVGRLPDDRWDGPGLGVWDLRSLVGHASRSLITVSTYLHKPAESATVGSAADYYVAAKALATADVEAVVERGRQAGLALGDAPREAVHALVDRVVQQVVASPDCLIETIAGGMWLRDYLPTRTFELVVHSQDIAGAAAMDLHLPLDVLASSAVLAAEIAVALGDGPDVLAALTGRVELPPGFSVV